MSETMKIVDENAMSRSKATIGRLNGILTNAKMHRFTLDEISNDLNEGQRVELVNRLESMMSKDVSPKTTTVEALRSFVGNSGFTGKIVATNIPALCTGISVNERNMGVCKTRGMPKGMQDYMRYSAHGLTFGTVFMKTRNGTSSDGTRTVESISLFVACNNCCDLFLGPIKNGTRQSTKFPNEWKSNKPKGKWTKPGQKPGKQVKGKKKARRPTSPLDLILTKIMPLSERNKEPYYHVTVTMLKAFCKSQSLNVPSSHRKGHLIRDFEEWISKQDATIITRWRKASGTS